MVSKVVTVINPSGLHLRPAGVLSQTAMKYQCSIIIEDGYVKGEEHFLAGDAPVAQDAAQPVMQSATPTWKAGSF